MNQGGKPLRIGLICLDKELRLWDGDEDGVEFE